jgi:hypothetical protein
MCDQCTKRVVRERWDRISRFFGDPAEEGLNEQRDVSGTLTEWWKVEDKPGKSEVQVFPKPPF